MTIRVRNVEDSQTVRKSKTVPKIRVEHLKPMIGQLSEVEFYKFIG